MDLTPERIQRAIRWRLGMSINAINEEAPRDWEKIDDW
jgi:hypothetical protein